MPGGILTKGQLEASITPSLRQWGSSSRVGHLQSHGAKRMLRRSQSQRLQERRAAVLLKTPVADDFYNLLGTGQGLTVR